MGQLGSACFGSAYVRLKGSALLRLFWGPLRSAWVRLEGSTWFRLKGHGSMGQLGSACFGSAYVRLKGSALLRLFFGQVSPNPQDSTLSSQDPDIDAKFSPVRRHSSSPLHLHITFHVVES